MTTHEGHDHPNTKAGRAACRRAALQGQAPTTAKQGCQNRHPAGKKAAPKVRKRKADIFDSALPHEFDADMENRTRCYVCKRGAAASIHSEGPSDLAQVFNFGARR